MIKTKIKMMVLSIALLFIALEFVGCKKCYVCYSVYRCARCIKTTDTTVFCATGNLNYADSMNRFAALGYQCNVFYVDTFTTDKCHDSKDIHLYTEQGGYCVLKP